jgi:cellulose synthase/poly-beta-1,6-N-acetylglucosamine synthase-like glycosyltransferase
MSSHSHCCDDPHCHESSSESDTESDTNVNTNVQKQNNIDTISKMPRQYSENELPGITLITPTYNRPNTIKLSVINFLSFDYPKDKLEWIIIDDSPKSIRDIIPDDPRIKYHYFDKEAQNKLYLAYVSNLKKNKKKKHKANGINDIHYKTGHFLNNRLPLGLKRNLAITYSNFDYIIHMDDDDYLPKDSIKERIFKMLDNPKIKCIACSNLNQFHSSKMASIKNKSPENVKGSNKYFECTFCYHKSFWTKQHFTNGDTRHEGRAFLKNRSDMCEDISPDKVIVALIHGDNEKHYSEIETNGWHFEKIPDELFLLICSF